MVNIFYSKDELFGGKMRNELTNKQGVYLLLSSDNSIVYIGRSNNLLSRLKIHRKDPEKIFCQVSIFLIECPFKTERMESEMIKIHKPIFNKQIPSSNRTNEDIFNHISYISRNMSSLKDHVHRLSSNVEKNLKFRY